MEQNNISPMSVDTAHMPQNFLSHTLYSLMMVILCFTFSTIYLNISRSWKDDNERL